ncbi:MAG: T9SS type A sorting domain-containing protein, partial [Bacteroidota bacterium]
AIWLGGVDPGGNLRLAAQTYRQNGHDYWPGPLDANGNVSSQTCSDYDQIWTVDGVDIFNFINDFNDNDNIDDPIPSSLLNWPGRGNPFFQSLNGFALPDQDLAPFYDNNDDGIYDPSVGDFPVYRHNDITAVPRSIAWLVINDFGDVHTSSGGVPLQVEVQQTYWTLTSQNHPVLNTALFRKDKVINKSNVPLDSFHFSCFLDADIGCFGDDYTGSIPELNSFYFYNGDDFDNGCLDASYGNNSPVFAHTFLNADLSTFRSYINGDLSPIGTPETPLDYYSFQTGVFKDGAPMEYGGDGYQEGTFVFPWFYPTNPNSSDPGAWSEVTEMNIPSDRRGIGTAGPYTFGVGEVLEFDQVFTFIQDPSEDHIETVDLLYDELPVIQSLYDEDFATNVSIPYCTSDCIWPGDANNDGIVDARDVLRFYNSSGITNEAARDPMTSQWFPNYNPNWPDELEHSDGISYAFADCNGDGLVDYPTDRFTILENFGRTNINFDGSSAQDLVGSGLTMNKVPFDTPLDSLKIGAVNQMEIRVSLPADQQGTLSGLSFELELGESIEAEIFDYTFLNPNNFDVLFTKDDDQRSLVFGATSSTGQTVPDVPLLLIARFNLRINETPLNCEIPLEFKNVQVVFSDGSFSTIPNEDRIWPVVGCVIVNTEDPQVASFDIDLFPNPTQELVWVHAEGQVIEDIRVVNTIGQVVAVPLSWDRQPSLDVRQLPEGVYFVSIETKNGRQTKRLVVQR